MTERCNRHLSPLPWIHLTSPKAPHYPREDVRAGVRATYYRTEPFDIEFADISLSVHPRVFIPEPSTQAIIDSMTVSPEDEVLDMACATGILGIIAGLRGAKRVLLADKDADAVANAADNITRHGLQARCEAIQTDCFSAVPKRAFDVIYFNGPFAYTAEYDDALREVFEYDEAPPMDSIFDAGFAILDRFFREAPAYLAPGGYIHTGFHNGSNEAAFADVITRNGFTMKERCALPSGHLAYELRLKD